MWLKACINGPRRKDEHGALPVTVEEIGADAGRVVAAGAAGIHVHVKNQSGSDTFEAGALANALAAIRGTAPHVPIGVTTGAWALPAIEDRLAAIRSWTVLPDFASVNWHEDGADQVAAALLDRGVGVEAGLWHDEAVSGWLSSPHRDRTLRVLIELQPDVPAAEVATVADRRLGTIRRAVGEAIPLLLHGEDANCWAALEHARIRGLASRIGLEDTLRMPDGAVAADNAALVRAARGW